MKTVIVDFIMEAASGPMQSQDAAFEAVTAAPAKVVTGLGKCVCGSENFVLANQMNADQAAGIPASRMYECTACGDYRLGL